MNKRENIYSLAGFTKVFKFTLLQTLKNPAYRASLIIFVLVMTFMGPLQAIMTQNSMSSAEEALSSDLKDSGITLVTIVNDTEVSLDQTAVRNAISDSASADVDVFVMQDSKVALENMKDTGVIIFINRSETGYSIKGVISDDSSIKASDLDSLTAIVKGFFDEARLAQSSLNPDVIARINAGISGGDVFTYEDYRAEQDKTVTGSNYFGYVLSYCIIAMVLISISNSYIMTSVTEEKTSKLVETLLVSVRPMALLMGKILGMMSYALSIIVLGFLGTKISGLAMTAIFGNGYSNVSAATMNFDIFTAFGVKGFIIILLEVGISYFSFALLSGLFGSACVKTEDIQNATGFTMMITMVGYMGAIFGGIPDNAAINVVMSMLPPFSYYCMPVMYLCGRISAVLMIIAFLIQACFIALLTILAARTYRNLILSDSSTPKLSAIFKSARG